MAEYDADRPFLIAVLAPFLCLIGLLGLLYSLSHLGYLKGIPELEGLLVFLHRLISARGLSDIRTLSFISILFLFGGIGLWSMRKWGAIITIMANVVMTYHAFTQETSNGPIIAMNVATAILVFFHFKEYH